jgi:hypothetical protein
MPQQRVDLAEVVAAAQRLFIRFSAHPTSVARRQLRLELVVQVGKAASRQLAAALRDKALEAALPVLERMFTAAVAVAALRALQPQRAVAVLVELLQTLTAALAPTLLAVKTAYLLATVDSARLVHFQARHMAVEEAEQPRPAYHLLAG